VSGFSAEWLELREPFDVAARATALVVELKARVDRGTHEAPLGIIDLGAGAGSNVRYLAPLLGGVQRWRLADRDPRLLEAALATTHAWADARGADVRRSGATLTIRAPDFECDLDCEPVDLADLDAVALPTRGLVTAAALLDLVSREWLDALAHRCRAAGAAVCFALNYDGRTTASPVEPEDAEVLALFNRHQLSNKGFGPALGPTAATAAQAALRERGYTVSAAETDWVIGSHATAMQHELLDGWLGAACAIDASRRDALTAWRERRRAHVAAGRSELRIGHVDVVGWL
jgi:hypothetical protein